MWSLQESRFALIIWVIFLVGLLASFFIMQSNVWYTDFVINTKWNYQEIKSSASSLKSLRDVITSDGTTLKWLKSNQLFGFTLSGTTDNIRVLDNYNTLTPLNNVDSWAVSPKGKIGIKFLLSDNSSNIPDANVGWAGTVTTLGTMNTQNKAGNLSTDAVARGWSIDSGWYIGYTFPSKDIILDKYIPDGTLVWEATVVVPFAPLKWDIVALDQFWIDTAPLTSAGWSMNVQRFWQQIVSKYNQELVAINKIPGTGATRCVLVNWTTKAILATGTFVWNECPITYSLVAGTTYAVEGDANGASYASGINGSVTGYPKTGISVDFISATNGGNSSGTSYIYTIAWVKIKR